MNGLTYIAPIVPLAVLTLMVGSLALWRQRWKIGQWAVTIGTVVIFLWSWPPVTTLLAGTLEWRYPRHHLPSKNMQAIVVLSSNFNAPEPPFPRTIPGFGTYLRCRCASWLHQNGWMLPVVVTGGRVGDRVIAAVMKETLIKEGVPSSDIWSEEESSSTYENALYTARLLLPRGIRKVVLVTETYHMLRAELCFRKLGFEVAPAPCGSTVFDGRDLEDWLPNAAAIRKNDAVFHEWVGLAWYALRGRL